MKSRTLIPLILFLTIISFSCEKVEITTTNINPSNPNALTDVLVVPNGSLVDGDMPDASNSSDKPVMTIIDPTMSYSAGSQVRLPIAFETSSSGISGLYFQINGAKQYFNVTVSSYTSSGTILLPISIPENVASGKFCITVGIYDMNGLVSNTFETCITVTKTYGCNVERVSGGEGITSSIHNMGDNAGMVKIIYETFTVPDRIDVFYGSNWVAGTGSNPGLLGSVPPLADCNNPTEGYVGDDGEFCFPYDPIIGDQVEVVVSGCVRGGTAWEYTIKCADLDENCSEFVGQDGNPRFNLKFTGDVDFDLYVKDPEGSIISYIYTTSPSGGELDVDCVCCEHGSENIFWTDGSAPTGTYEYWIDFFSACNSSSSSYTLTVTSNGSVMDVKTGNLSSVGDESQHYTYVH